MGNKPLSTLVYLANVRIPSEKAHVIQIFKNCEAFARQCLDVELWFPSRRATGQWEGLDDVFHYYQVESSFRLKQIRCPDIIRAYYPVWSERIFYFAHSVLVASFLTRHLRSRNADILYTRDPFIATALARRRLPFLYEAHTLSERTMGRRWMKYLGRAARGIVVTTSILSRDIAALGLEQGRLFVAPDGVSQRQIDSEVDRHLARERLALEPSPPIACYTGHLYSWKGPDVLIDCARETPEVSFLLVGGVESDIRRLKEKVASLSLTNVHIIGYVPPSKVGLYLSAADFLLLPNTDEHRLSSRDTSPMKAFEYMASGRPIIASDLPSLREIFHDEVDALLVPPGDPKAVRSALRRLLSDPVLGSRLARNAKGEAQRYTWDNRVRGILEFAYRVGFPAVTPG